METNWHTAYIATRISDNLLAIYSYALVLKNEIRIRVGLVVYDYT
jgi:hypothetical protein